MRALNRCHVFFWNFLGIPGEEVGATAAKRLIENWETVACVDEHLQDQVRQLWRYTLYSLSISPLFLVDRIDGFIDWHFSRIIRTVDFAYENGYLHRRIIDQRKLKHF